MFSTKENPLGIIHLGDVSAFLIQITAADISGSTNYHTFFVVATSGCKVYWGDSTSTTLLTGTNTCTHTYSAAGMYLIRIEGAHTRFYHQQAGTPGKVIEAIKLCSGITSGSGSWYGCNNSLFHLNPAYCFHEGILDLSGHFANCNGAAFAFSDCMACPSTCTSLYNFAIGCNGAGFTSLKNFKFITGCLSNQNAFWNAMNLSSDISDRFPHWASGNSVYLTNIFKGTKVTGAPPAAELWERDDITWYSSGAFPPTVDGYDNIPAGWK